MKSTRWHNIDKNTLRKFCFLIIFGILYAIWHRLMNIGIPCIFYKFTNLYCPGCGVTRMLLALLELDFIQAFKSNCFAFLLLPYGILVLIRHYAYVFVKGERYPYKKYHSYILMIILILTFVFGIARNMPSLDFLRPS